MFLHTSGIQMYVFTFRQNVYSERSFQQNTRHWQQQQTKFLSHDVRSLNMNTESQGCGKYYLSSLSCISVILKKIIFQRRKLVIGNYRL